VQYWLKPGESFHESWWWSGRVLVNGSPEPLAPGHYFLVGWAGDYKGTVEVSIEVVEA
jgi:hypothetical protein